MQCGGEEAEGRWKVCERNNGFIYSSPSVLVPFQSVGPIPSRQGHLWEIHDHNSQEAVHGRSYTGITEQTRYDVSSLYLYTDIIVMLHCWLLANCL